MKMVEEFWEGLGGEAFFGEGVSLGMDSEVSKAKHHLEFALSASCILIMI